MGVNMETKETKMVSDTRLVLFTDGIIDMINRHSLLYATSQRTAPTSVPLFVSCSLQLGETRMPSIVFRILGPRAADKHAEAGRMVEQHVGHPITYENCTSVKPESREHHEQVDLERMQLAELAEVCLCGSWLYGL